MIMVIVMDKKIQINQWLENHFIVQSILSICFSIENSILMKGKSTINAVFWLIFSLVNGNSPNSLSTIDPRLIIEKGVALLPLLIRSLRLNDFWPWSRHRQWIPHMPFLFSKSILTELHSIFAKEIDLTSSHRKRFKLSLNEFRF